MNHSGTYHNKEWGSITAAGVQFLPRLDLGLGQRVVTEEQRIHSVHALGSRRNFN